ncbi:MAG: hypothetical protein A2Y61_08265 [Chloroflexi bacterium RBG_13_60_13]|nr:MAG: hypothetical protein A2Y61_08265 [Chloroflexi bacterium RBG_13_60_13]
MNLGVNLTDVLSFFLPSLFAVWPILLLAPLSWQQRSLRSFAAVWCLLALVRLSLVFFQGTGIRLIPEPLSTALFLASGALIGVIAVILRLRRT